MFYGIPFTFVNGLYNYQLLDVLSAVRCTEILVFLVSRCHTYIYIYIYI
jgi:hypothetical protein